MNKLYIEKYYREKNIIEGAIYDRPKINKLDYLRLLFIAERISESVYTLKIFKYKNEDKCFEMNFDETMYGKMNLKNILYYVENNFNVIMSYL